MLVLALCLVCISDKHSTSKESFRTLMEADRGELFEELNTTFTIKLTHKMEIKADTVYIKTVLVNVACWQVNQHDRHRYRYRRYFELQHQYRYRRYF